ncbi:hypothetical protein CCACVL1_19650 [Corchorus capsularis]|uniref:Uncharacterized protein n=1 Tax=Corchorus capsularis TaxID=210143 RepID=A0A1R3HFW4_COCAP|nr:hypothetical protein CCACVL1_19650 [Corchorus capsularis]
MFHPTTKSKNCCFALNHHLPRRAASLKTNLALTADATTPTLQEVDRPLAHYPPDIWGDCFINLQFSDSEFESCSREVEVFKGMAKNMLMASSKDPLENIFMLNTLYRLGLSYHYEDEIEQQLSHLFITLPELMDNKDYDLHTTAIIFQVFRSNGYKMSCEVFHKFTNGDGLFKEEVASDIQGMLSLYEASQWRLHGEDILDEALAFTTSRLESMAKQLTNPYLADYIEKVLHRPYHKGMPRLEAKQYISFYEKDDSRNDTLLKFAKYDFNRVQMLHQQELKVLTSWFKESNIETRIPYARHRTVECFFCAVGMFFEPRFALARKILTQWYVATSLIDDSYDAYGTYEEVQHFTKAFKRFDIRAKDELPIEYLRTLYEVVMNIFAETEEEMSKRGRAYSVDYTKKELMKMVQLYDVQARWLHEGSRPTFDEYLEIGICSIGGPYTMALCMIGIEEADETVYQWAINPDNKIVRLSGLLSRLYDDTQTDEEKRGEISGRDFYMKHYGVSKEEAIEGLSRIACFLTVIWCGNYSIEEFAPKIQQVIDWFGQLQALELTAMAVPLELFDPESLIKSASTSLNSKVVSQYSTLLAPLAVDSVVSVVDPEKPDLI